MRPNTKPIQAHANLSRNCTTLYFKDNESADYYLRGAVCWPIEWPDQTKPEISGHILIAGQDIKTKDVTIFKEKSFVSVSNIINSDGKIEYPGLESWFNSAWAKYYCRDYFWHGNEVTTKQWRLETIRNQLIGPKPYFLRIDWSEDDQAMIALWHGFKVGKINFKPIGRDSQTFIQLSRIKQGDKVDLPAVLSLTALIAGYNRYPYRG